MIQLGLMPSLPKFSVQISSWTECLMRSACIFVYTFSETMSEFVKAWFLQLSSHLSVQLNKKKMPKWHKPKPRKFLLEVSGVPNSAFSQWQDLSNDVILLPLASPNLAKIPFQTNVNQHAFLSRNIWKMIKELFVHIKDEGICYLPWVSVGYMSCQA